MGQESRRLKKRVLKSVDGNQPLEETVFGSADDLKDHINFQERLKKLNLITPTHAERTLIIRP